jgi:hypothetical protein
MDRITGESYHQNDSLLMNENYYNVNEDSNASANGEISASSNLAAFIFTQRHSSIMGNIILIAHAAFLLLDVSEDNVPTNTTTEGDNSLNAGLAPQPPSSSSSDGWDSSFGDDNNNNNPPQPPQKTFSR